MPASFLTLPAEIRNEIYVYLLVRREPLVPWNGAHEIVPNVLCTNTTILHEARSLLYSHNRFDLTTWNPQLILQFLDNVGYINAGHLRCIRIDFPRLRDLEDSVSLEEDSLCILEKIQTHCTNLRTLMITPDSTNAREHQLDSFDSPKICAKALALVDARFRAISSLEEIIVEVYEEGPSREIRRKMESHGWTISVVEPVEEAEWNCDRSWDDFEDDQYLSDDYDEDEYDIDNDSDFWRRAAD